MLTTRDILNVEILSPGRWSGSGCPPGGCVFTEDDLDRYAANYKADYQPPIKLGHDENQKLLQADGYPAAGWLSNVRTDVVDGVKRLFADLVRVPEKIAALMEAGAYKHRSVEVHGDFVTGLALLGADLPAVENLNDIMAWYSKQFSLDDEKVIVFTSPAAPVRPLLHYADNVDQLLTDLTAFIQRTGGLVSLRAERGKSLNETNRALVTSLRDGLRDAEVKLGTFIEDTAEPDPPPVQPDYSQVMHARTRLAALRQAELVGVHT